MCCEGVQDGDRLSDAHFTRPVGGGVGGDAPVWPGKE